MVIPAKTLYCTSNPKLQCFTKSKQNKPRVFHLLQPCSKSHFTKVAFLPDLDPSPVQLWTKKNDIKGFVPMTSADENRNRQLVLLNTFVSPCEPQQLHYMDSRSQIDGAGGWHCLTVRTRKIYFHRWSHKSKGKVQRWCKQRIVAHLFHRYWQMPKQ